MTPHRLILALALALLGGSAWAAAPAKPNAADRKFVQEAAEGGLLEVQLGHLAVQKAADPQVKEFGERMVTDHSKANDQLLSVASQLGITLPTKPSKEGQKAYDQLDKLSGTAFDRQYAATMVQDHTKDVKAFTKQAQTGKNPDIRKFAATTLPVLQEHLKMAKELEAKTRGVGGTGQKPVKQVIPQK
ncbi:MAG: DUF4142 domain-containing protein [Myxococcales bacterium]